MAGRGDESGRGGRGGGRKNDGANHSNYRSSSGGGRYRDGNSGRGRGRGADESGRGRGGGQGGRLGGVKNQSLPPQSHQHRTDQMAAVGNSMMPPRQPAAHSASSVPQGYLPPFLPGSASLVEQLDQKLLVVLRDGRHLVGTLRTFDQFSNMVLEDTCERRILVVHRNKEAGDEKCENKTDTGTICYQADVKLGLYIVRGDSVVLMGEVDDSDEEEIDNTNATGTNEQEECGKEEATKNSTNKRKIHLVSLEELEKIQEEEREKEESDEGEEKVVWDFDLDLVA